MAVLDTNEIVPFIPPETGWSKIQLEGRLLYTFGHVTLAMKRELDSSFHVTIDGYEVFGSHPTRRGRAADVADEQEYWAMELSAERLTAIIGRPCPRNHVRGFEIRWFKTRREGVLYAIIKPAWVPKST